MQRPDLHGSALRPGTYKFRVTPYLFNGLRILGSGQNLVQNVRQASLPQPFTVLRQGDGLCDVGHCVQHGCADRHAIPRLGDSRHSACEPVADDPSCFMVLVMDYATPNLPSRDFEETAQFFATLGFREGWRDRGWMILTRGGLHLARLIHEASGPVSGRLS